ncbi:MAG TPA: hypothetical protein VF571_04430 [Pyrinomonadaceae bacterium]
MLKALASGLFGAVVLNLVHETVRQFSDQAPHVDLLGQQAIAETYEYFGTEPPAKNELYAMALTGDLTSNAAYYSLAAAGGAKNAVLTGTILGAAAGIGAVYLPDKIGLRSRYAAKTPQRAAMTVAYYTLGGVAAGVAYSLIAEKDD